MKNNEIIFFNVTYFLDPSIKNMYRLYLIHCTFYALNDKQIGYCYLTSYSEMYLEMLRHKGTKKNAILHRVALFQTRDEGLKL